MAAPSPAKTIPTSALSTAATTQLPPPQYESCPPFAPGSSSSGRWTVNHYVHKFGASCKMLYDNKPVILKYWCTAGIGFDMNEFDGKPSDGAVFNGSGTFLGGLTPQAKEAVISSLTQLRSDQVVFRDVFSKFLLARPDIAKPSLDQDTGTPIPPKIENLVKIKPAKMDPKKPDKKMDPMVVINAKLQTERTDPDVHKHRILVPIFVGKVPQTGLTRGGYQDLLFKKRYIANVTAELTGFAGNLGTFLGASASVIRLVQLKTNVEKTPEEIKQLVEETTDIFSKLGIDVDEEEAPAPAPAPAPAGTPSADAPPSPMSQDKFLGGFTELETGK